MTDRIRVLVLCDGGPPPEAIRSCLTSAGFLVECSPALSAPLLRDLVLRVRPDAVLAVHQPDGDLCRSGLSACDWQAKGAPFLILCDRIEFEHAMAFMREGACDVLMGAPPDSIGEAIKQAVESSRARSARRATEVERNRFFNLSLDLFCIGSFDGHFRQINPAWQEMLGWAETELVGHHYSEFVHPEVLSNVEEALESLRRGVNIRGLESRIKCKDGSWRWLIWDALPLPEEQVIYAIGRDVTERKSMEEQMYRVQRMESIGVLAGGVAHDLNNALAPILLATGMFKLENPGKTTDTIDIIEQSARRCAVMISQLLTFARGSDGAREAVDMSRLVREAANFAEETFMKSIEIVLDAPEDLHRVHGDATKLQQVLISLCVNARDALPDGGVLRITARNADHDAAYVALRSQAQAGPHVVITVEDNGPGMSAAVRSRVFDPFYTTKPVGKGTGMGLATALSVVRSHGGIMDVDSAPGAGAKFTITLPAISRIRDPAAASEAAPVRGAGQLILVVDDEAPVREMMERVLLDAGYRVLKAGDGVEALAVFAARSRDIALVITDLMMPVMDGPATIQVLRKMREDLPILATTGISTSERQETARLLGVTSFLAKPYAADALLEVVHATLNADTSHSGGPSS